MAAGTEFRSGARSALAILAGLVSVFAVSLGTDAVLHATGVFPPWGEPMAGTAPWVFITGYRLIYCTGGSWLTARLAPNRPMGHALALGVLGLAISIMGVIVSWNTGPEMGPRWYPIALAVTALPCAWLGGKLYEMGTARA